MTVVSIVACACSAAAAFFEASNWLLPVVFAGFTGLSFYIAYNAGKVGYWMRG